MKSLEALLINIDSGLTKCRDKDMIKYSHKRIDIAPKSNKTQQTHRHILPVLVLWKDEKKYNMVGIQAAWWKWTITLFFKTVSK